MPPKCKLKEKEVHQMNGLELSLKQERLPGLITQNKAELIVRSDKVNKKTPGYTKELVKKLTKTIAARKGHWSLVNEKIVNPPMDGEAVGGKRSGQPSNGSHGKKVKFSDNESDLDLTQILDDDNDIMDIAVPQSTVEPNIVPEPVIVPDPKPAASVLQLPPPLVWPVVPITAQPLVLPMEPSVTPEANPLVGPGAINITEHLNQINLPMWDGQIHDVL
ncbi:hypothetical protein DXG01_013580 [Tephrocybe rancida]|nr:hypothetical protein DXG01_013580 [Tephrocybe rancida]